MYATFSNHSFHNQVICQNKTCVITKITRQLNHEPGLPQTFWLRRVFWALVCTVATIVFIMYSYMTVAQVVDSPVSFVQETSYLRWNTEFPSVSICETDADLGNIEVTAERIFGSGRDPIIDSYLREIAFFDGKCFTCKEVCGEELDCPTNFSDLAREARVSCTKLMSNCEWNGQKFDCCSNFLPLETEIGPCFSINSLQTNRSSQIEMYSNSTTGPGKLSLSVHREVFVFLHSKEDLPFYNAPEKMKELVMLSAESTITYQINEIESDPAVYAVPVESRKCRFPRENRLKHHKLYSYSSCVTECRLKAQMELCNCTHHFMKSSGQVPVCRLEQFDCLLKHSELFTRLKPQHSPEVGLGCQCESSCTEHDLVVVSKHSRSISESNQSNIIIKMQNLPSERFKRYLIKGSSDIFVTIGGLLGLYIGGSVLSVVEVVYFLCFRKI